MPIIKQRFPVLILVSFMLMLFSACENDLDVNADWKEIPVVFGILDPSQANNYIRIQKAFLGSDGSAFQWAQEPDSSFLDNITVKLIEMENGVTRREFPLELVVGDTIGLAKDSGIFAGSPNYLYRTSEPIRPSRIGKVWTYRLIIFNNDTREIYSALATIPGAVQVYSPFNGSNDEIYLKDDNVSPVFISYQEGLQVKMYDFQARFIYEEWDVNNPGNVKRDSVVWNMFTNKKTVSLTGQRNKNIQARGATLYEILEATLDSNINLRRKAIDMGFYFYGGGQELFTYIEVNTPSIGIVQKKPEYTNIEGGLGIFSAKHTTAFPHVKITDDMHKRLRISRFTDQLNFQ